MSLTKISVPREFAGASTEQRVAYVQELWDEIARYPENVPIPESHIRELEARLAEHKADPAAALPWSEVRQRLLNKLQES
ncbi:MAG: addiction module protein [Gammaproteobacteria bacterium]|nr:addiction module protein [Gammaproteobacteria bacterium]